MIRGPYEPDRIRIEEMFDWVRRDGRDICDYCGCPYRDHAPVPGYEWLRKLCDGELVKLT